MSSPDHYALLGVPRFASQRLVRAAFIRSIRPYSATMTGGESPDGSLRDLLAAYWTLRHPERRAAYDAELRSRPEQRRPPAPSLPPPGRRPLRRYASPWLFLGSIVLMAAALLVAQRYRHDVTRSVVAVASQWTDSSDDESPASRPQMPMIDRAIEHYPTLRAQVGASGIIGFLRQCFNELSASGTPARFDYCATIDSLAAAEWADEPPPLGAFFRFEARQARVDDTVVIPESALQARWAAVDRMALVKALARSPRLSRPPPR